MLILRLSARDVTNDRANTMCIGFTQLHGVLGLAHFARRDHFHRLSDLLSVLDTRDLVAYFFAAGHVS